MAADDDEVRVTEGWGITAEDEWMKDIIDEIHLHGLPYEPKPSDPPLYDTSFGENKTLSFEDSMGRDIAMLVRCNQEPESLLAEYGVSPPPKPSDLDDVSQLVGTGADGSVTPTEFFVEAVNKMFNQHAKLAHDGKLVMDAASIANWLTHGLGASRNVGSHDKRVLLTISRFGEYGSGRLTGDDFLKLYVSALSSALEGPRRKKDILGVSRPTVGSIFSDIRNHGIIPPLEQEYNALVEQSKKKVVSPVDTLMDECELIELEEDEATGKIEGSRQKNSHELVHLAKDGKSPLFLEDGDFIYIDEEACIGCTLCATTSPNSFSMLGNGKARTYQQRKGEDVDDAITACPASCMHKVSFPELVKLETGRDQIDIISQRKSRQADYRGSYYHNFKAKCFLTGGCPNNGCYQCPRFGSAGENPFLKQRQQDAIQARAETLKEDKPFVDAFRKFADL